MSRIVLRLGQRIYSLHFLIQKLRYFTRVRLGLLNSSTSQAVVGQTVVALAEQAFSI